MVSKTLVKLIDEAVIPAVALVSAKVLGSILVAEYLNLNWEMSKTGLVFSSSEEFVAANSYSSLIMFGFVVLGLAWVVIRARSLHETHITPRLSARLASLRMLPLVQDTKTIYSSAFVWLSYTWLTTVILGVQAFTGTTYSWVAIVALIVSLKATWFIVSDVEKEVFPSPKREETVTVKERVLKFAE